MNDSPQRIAALLLFILAATAIVYLPGLWGPFVFDDKPNLLANPFIHLKTLTWASIRDAAFSNHSGLLGRPISSLSFALNHYAADGFVSFPFKLTNLVIHGLNGCLVLLLSRRICARLGDGSGRQGGGDVNHAVPVVIAALWLLHPLQLTSVLYVVQRMNSLSAFFTLAGLVLYMHGRERVERNVRGGFSLMLAGLFGGGVLGVFCKENAALLPVYALVLELSCFGDSMLDRARRLRLRLLFIAVLGLPAVAALAYVVIHPDFILGPYQSREFSLGERLLTQPRVLFFYAALALFPSKNALGLYHDDLVNSSGLLEPSTTLLAIGGWILLITLAVVFRRKLPVLFFCVAWFLGGHSMESSVIALEMVFEHRNYLPILGPLFGLVYALRSLFKRVEIEQRVGALVFVLIACTFGFVTHSRAHSWSSAGLLLESQVKHHPNAARSHGHYAEEIINTRGDIHKAFYHLQQFSRLQPDAIVGLAEMARIAEGFRIVDLPQESLPDDGSESLSVFEIPLVNHPEHLEKISRLVYAELENRLREAPVSANTVKTFVDLQNCLYRGTQVCVEMVDDYIRWIELALERQMEPLFRAILLMTNAKNYSWSGNIDKAVEYAELSVQTLPNDVNLSIDLVKLHLALENFERGLEIIENMSQKKKLIGYRENEIKALEEHLNAGNSKAARDG